MHRARVFLILPFLATQAVAQLDTEAYLKPPQEIERLVMSPIRYQNITLSNLSPTKTQYILAADDGMPALALLARDHVNLGGLQVDTAANRARTITIRGSVSLKLFDIATQKITAIETPKNAEFSGISWSPDGTQAAYIAAFDDRTQIYIADAKTGKSRPLTSAKLLATLVTNVSWSGNGKEVFAVLVPQNRTVPQKSVLPNEPKVRLSDGVKHRFRTYPSVLESTYDQSLLEYYTVGQLAAIDAKTGRIRNIGAPAMIRTLNPSPDGQYVRVSTVQKPFSYLVPTSSFGTKEELWDKDGKAVSMITERRMQLGDPAPAPGGGPPATPDAAKRNLAWRPDGQGMTYLEAEPAPKPATPPADDEQGRNPRPGGAGGAQQPDNNRKDRVLQWLPPYGKEDAKVIYTHEGRISGLTYSQDCKTLFITDTKAGNNRLLAVNLDAPDKPMVITTTKTGETLTPVGDLVTKPGTNGESVAVVSSDGSIYLQGSTRFKDPSKQAPRPFLDKVEIATGKKTRIFESSDIRYETLSTLLDDEAKQVVIQRQSRYEFPNNFLLDLGTKNEVALTHNQDPTPEITNCQRFTFEIVRVDGFKFQVKVTLPATWKKGDLLPAMFWFYPAEFVDQAAYDKGKESENINTFTAISPQSMALLTQLGYAYVEPDLPITGPQGQMNDEYVPLLQNSLYAIINKLEKEGMIDRDRLAIGGHSYGAFSTANAMVNTPYFKAGIAGSGAYNRLLTPLGFQNENRLLWDARETYLSMSPLLYADRLNGALLMTHGMEDQNVGTFPINSERMFQALNQLGKPAALYMYPYEDHGQVAQETVLDKWARWVAWLEKYVKPQK